MASSCRAASFTAFMLSGSSAGHSPSITMTILPLKAASKRPAMAQQRDMAVIGFGAKGGLISLKSGANVLERPTFNQSQFDSLPQVHEGGDMGRLGDKRGLSGGDSYRVLLVDDARHTEKLVVNVLPQIVPSITVDHARKLFYECRKDGVSVVIVAVKEHAEFYSQVMLRWGLRSAIEPDSDLA